MYRIIVRTNGKYHNVMTGYRYCLTKKSAKSLIDTFIDAGCEIGIEKFIRLHHDVFCWSSYDEDSVLRYYDDKMWELEEEE